MNLVWGHTPTVKDWIERFHGYIHDTEPSEAAAVVDADGVMVGAVVLEFKNQHTAEVSQYGAFSGDTMKAFFRAAFHDAGLSRLEARIPVDLKSRRRTLPKIGFQFEHREPNFYGLNQDAYVYRMTPDKCRWINGIEEQAAARA